MGFKIKKPIIIRQNLLPIGSFKAMNLFGIIFAKKNANLNERTMNHETIHTNQVVETLFVGFYAWYLLEWLIRLVAYHITFLYKGIKNGFKTMEYDFKWAYKNIGFEREAYANDRNMDYLENRKLYAWIKYLFKK